MYEVEIKSLLGTKEATDTFRISMKNLDHNLRTLGSHKQLNYYFIGGDVNVLFEKVSMFLNEQEREVAKGIRRELRDYSLRSRLADNKVSIVLKASVDDTTSANGVGRFEFEKELPIPFKALNQLILDNGFSYQAKWSREREEYTFRDMYVTIDKNAGYGYLAEFEIQVEREDEIATAKNKIRKAMRDLDMGELDQNRLERMFTFYNAHWLEYYGTDKVFVVK